MVKIMKVGKRIIHFFSEKPHLQSSTDYIFFLKEEE